MMSTQYLHIACLTISFYAVAISLRLAQVNLICQGRVADLPRMVYISSWRFFSKRTL